MNQQLVTEVAHCPNCGDPYPAELPECPDCQDRDTLAPQPVHRLTVRRVSTGEVLETMEWAGGAR